MAHLEVLRPGPLALIQDWGRPGHQALGVSPSGAADRGAYARANQIVGNPPGAAVIEMTLGGLSVRAHGHILVGLTGAACAGAAMDRPLALADGALLRLAAPRSGLRTYLAVRGGIDVAPVLGSRSTDTLSGLGPAWLRPGDVLPVGTAAAGPAGPARDTWRDGPDESRSPGGARPVHDHRVLALLRGPRDDWLPSAAWDALPGLRWRVSTCSDRIAIRLEGNSLPIRQSSIPPEPLVRGAVQVPPDGLPIVFLADHPATGGYPVIGVLTPDGCDAAAQMRPGRTASLREESAALISAPPAE